MYENIRPIYNKERGFQVTTIKQRIFNLKPKIMKKLFTLLTALVASTGMALADDTYIITGHYNSWSLENNCITFTAKDGGYTATVDEFKTGTEGFKIIKNPATTGWDCQFGYDEPISTGTDYTLVSNGGNIYLGSANNDVTLHNVTFEFYPSSDGTPDYFRITADETITVDKSAVDNYMMVGTWQGWSFEKSPLKFEYQGDNVYTASIDEIYGDWKIVKNNSWTGALGNGNTELEPGNTYTLQKNGDNTGFATGKVLKNAKFTLTILEDGSATLKVEGTFEESHSYGLIGTFQSWDAANGTLFTEQSDGSWTVDVTAFPGGEDFKISIDKTWECFLAQDAPTALTFAETYTCGRGDNNNNFTIGEKGTSYDIHAVLIVADDAQSADLTITTTTDGITLLKTKVGKKAIYNIAGQKLTEAQKGLNIIDGKKVIMNK